MGYAHAKKELMRFVFLLGALSLAFGAFPAAAQTLNDPLQISLPDGTIAQAEDRCGAGDLCGTVKLPDGDSLKIYSSGSAKCQPYTLKVLRMHGDATLFSYDVQTRIISKNDDWSFHLSGQNCRYQNSYFVLDKGRVSMGVFQNSDGSLSVRFSQQPVTTPSPQT